MEGCGRRCFRSKYKGFPYFLSFSLVDSSFFSKNEGTSFSNSVEIPSLCSGKYHVERLYFIPCPFILFFIMALYEIKIYRGKFVSNFYEDLYLWYHSCWRQANFISDLILCLFLLEFDFILGIMISFVLLLSCSLHFVTILCFIN